MSVERNALNNWYLIPRVACILLKSFIFFYSPVKLQYNLIETILFLLEYKKLAGKCTLTRQSGYK